jgi:hypothetical protein
MRQKVALIAKIRAIESVPVIRFKVSVQKEDRRRSKKIDVKELIIIQ